MVMILAQANHKPHSQKAIASSGNARDTFFLKEVTMSKNQQPFFARYLEGQAFPEVKTNVKAGPLTVTHKHPSDSDEGDVTMKYPSDDDEGIAS
jgi:hypothetical protein